MSSFSRALQRTFFWVFRGTIPVLNAGKRTYVFRDDLVREIVERNNDFTNRQINKENIERHLGPFLLGMDESPELFKEQEAIRAVAKKEDLLRIRTLMQVSTQEVLNGIQPGEPWNLVQQYALEIPYRLISEYVGTPGSDRETMLRWNRTLFWDAFLNLKSEVEPRKAATVSGVEMKGYLNSLIQEQKAKIQAGESVPDTLLTRLIRNQLEQIHPLDDDGIRRNISGILLGTVQNQAKCCVFILEQLLLHPKAWDEARKAALENNIDQVMHLSFDAMRLHSPIPVLIRFAEKAQTVSGNGTKHYKIKAGKDVFALTSSAMLDKRKFPHPKEIRGDRPMMDYLYFGLGLHKCYGEHINYVVIPEMIAAILRMDSLKPAKGKAGKIVNEGPFPKDWFWQKG